LLQSIIEKSGVATVSISLLMEVTGKVAPPRVLSVDRPLGFPLGGPGDSELQRSIMWAALNLLTREVSSPIVEDFQAGSRFP
jgi:D-proline reductase (dithiol) PrdB